MRSLFIYVITGVEITIKKSGTQQDYLAGKSSSPQKYLVVWKWPRFKQNNMKNKKNEKYSKIL